MKFLIGFFILFVLSYIVGFLLCKLVGADTKDINGLAKYIAVTVIGYIGYIFIAISIATGISVVYFIYFICTSIGGLFI